ncbi:sensor domain-containing diguanylate cyclase [Thalassolituus sp. LLYu03]|uniref:sensor domain-containing diguanylate cyclase n=1 Tax=Thalassolituus sp. LLYu03 TaxID=3421656 RepID=UPI003D297534
MPAHPIPEQEEKRLAALKALDILYAPLEERFDRITRTLCRVFNVPFAYLALMDGDTQWFKSIQGAPLISVPRRDSLCQHTLMEEEHLVCGDLMHDPRFANNPFVTGPYAARFYAGMLLKSRGQNVGTLCIVDNKTRTFSEDDLQALRDLTHWAQTELHFTQLTDTQIELLGELDVALQQARIDSLTRLWNQGTIKQILHRAFHRHLLNLSPLSVLMIDADHFKRVNDHFGHATGDRVLQAIASALRQSLRPDDAIGRYGGEEFMVVLDNCPVEQATVLAKRILNRVRSLTFADVSPDLVITVSVGIAGSDARGLENEGDLLDLADQALYRAKHNGRDQICVLHETDPSANG